MKKNIFIYIGQVIALLIILVFILNKEATTGNLYSVLINLAYSYTAAFIFYILQILIPNAKQQMIAKKLLAPSIHKVCADIEEFIALTENVIIINNDHIQINGMDDDGLVLQKV